MSETGTSEDQHNFYSTYFPTVENFGGDKMVDPYDGNPIFYTIYFDSLQYLYDYEVIYNFNFIGKIENLQRL